MTEVPEHLLQRSRDRRKALGVPPSPGDTGAATPDVAAEVSASAPAVVGDAAPAAAAAKVPVALPASPPPPPEKPTAPWVNAANDRQKIPSWVMPVLLFLPIWVFMYVGTLESPTRLEGLIYEGGEIYQTNCASCHGATGGGGSGPALNDGTLAETFTHFEDQIEWVVKGTSGFEAEGRETYGDTNKVVGGSGAKMPGFAGKLTAEEITLAVFYERIELAGAAEEFELGETIFDKFEHGDFDVEEFGETITAAELEATFAEVRAAIEALEAAAG